MSDASRYRANWQDEIDSAALYRAMADVESSDQLREVYRRLAGTEEKHAGFWEERMRSAGAAVPPRRVGWRTRVLAAIARRFGTQMVLPTLDSLEQADSGGYLTQPEASGTAMPDEERSHARVLRTLAGGAGVEGSALARFEGRHRAASGNALRAAVLGANDGLLSNFSLVMGVAGAQVSAHTILITGLAGLLAGAGSMASPQRAARPATLRAAFCSVAGALALAVRARLRAVAAHLHVAPGAGAVLRPVVERPLARVV